MEDVYASFKAATKNLYVRNIAIELPYIDANGNMSSEKNRAMDGYCLDQLRKRVYPQSGDGKLQTVPVDNSPDAINHWFNQLQRDIMITKLKGIIGRENNVLPAEVTPEIDIDGNTTVKVAWTPTRLYPNLKIDSSYFKSEEWSFENEKESWQKTDKRSIEVELGQIKHKAWGVHKNSDSIQLGLSLPTPYDDELERLEIQKPIPETKFAVDRLVFSFFLPFWLCCAIIAAILLYIILFFKAVSRNKSLKFRCRVRIIDNATGEEIVNKMIPKAVDHLTVGRGGEGSSSVSWSLEVYKVQGNPFLLFDKPVLRWRQKTPYVYDNRKGKTEGEFNTSLSLYAGAVPKKDGDPAHTITFSRR